MAQTPRGLSIQATNDMNKRVNQRNLKSQCNALVDIEPRFQNVLDKYGYPPLWDKPESFATLIDIILGQQVSLDSARACFDKLGNLIGEITPERFIGLDDDELRSVGFSRQKTAYGRETANALLTGTLRLENLRHLEDAMVKTELEKVKGIGNWTSDIYLLMAMLRPDVMPRGDIALHAGWQDLAGLDKRPDADEFLMIAADWSPYRSVAARLLWHFYLSERGRRW